MMRRRVVELVYGSDLHATRFLLALAELVWALALFWPGDTFGRPTYALMAEVAREETWAWLFLLSAFCQFQILWSGSYHTKPATLFAFFNSLLWMFVTLSMYLSVYPPPAAISGELAMAVGACWVFVRSGVPCLALDDAKPHRRCTDYVV